jgi:hypothetical protein
MTIRKVGDALSGWASRHSASSPVSERTESREMPGPDAAFSLADTGPVGALLSGAGFGGIEFATADEPMLIGRDVDDVL